MKKLKLLKASSYYANYLAMLHKPDFENGRYQYLYDNLTDDFYDWADAWKYYLEKTGKFEVFESVINYYPLQKVWAEEKNIKYNQESWKLEILEAQIKEFKPDIFFAHDSSIITSEFLKKIKEEVKSIRLVIGYDGTAQNNIVKFTEHDLIISCLKSTADYYTKKGKTGFYLPFGFDDRVLKKITSKQKQIYFSFVGSIFYSKGYHSTRFEILSALARKTDIILFTDNYKNLWNKFDRRQIIRLLKGRWDEFLNFYSIAVRRQNPVFGLEMYSKIADSSLTFNSHLDTAGPYAANRRLFEATGVGTALLTDWKENIEDFFIPGKEILTYESTEECIDIVNFYKNNKNSLYKIGDAGKERTLKDHSLQKRFNAIAEFLYS